MVIVAGVLSVLVVLNIVTMDQLIINMSTLLQLSVIVLVVAAVLIMLLQLNKK